jgi:hypothetical protein
MVRLAHEDTDLVRQAKFHSGPWQAELFRPRLSVRLRHLMADGAPVLSRLGVDQFAPGVLSASFGERACQNLSEGRTMDRVRADFVDNSHKPARGTDRFSHKRSFGKARVGTIDSTLIGVATWIQACPSGWLRPRPVDAVSLAARRGIAAGYDVPPCGGVVVAGP